MFRRATQRQRRLFAATDNEKIHATPSDDDRHREADRRLAIHRVAGAEQNATSAKFSDATRNKVLKAAQDLGYRMTTREPLDTAITANEKNLIVYLADEISTSLHPVVNIDGARDTAFANGQMLAVYSTHGNAEIEQQVLDATLTNPNVLGVIYATVYKRKVTLPAALSKVPTVLLNCYTGDSELSCRWCRLKSREAAIPQRNIC